MAETNVVVPTSASVDRVVLRSRHKVVNETVEPTQSKELFYVQTKFLKTALFDKSTILVTLATGAQVVGELLEYDTHTISIKLGSSETYSPNGLVARGSTNLLIYKQYIVSMNIVNE